MDFRSGLAGVMALIALSGCVNRYEQSYLADDHVYDVLTNRAAPAPERPAVSRMAYSESEAVGQDLRRKGFQSLGYSFFKTEYETPDSMAIEQAKNVGADLVVITYAEPSGSYERTREVSEPVGKSESVTSVRDKKGRRTGETITTETTLYETRYVTSTVYLYSYGAFYWVRTKSGLGLQVTWPDEAIRKARKTKGGAQIKLVIYGSPAERAELQENDIIESVDGKTIASPYMFDAFPHVPGQALKLVITRDGKKLEKTLIADERPPMPLK
ncbi:PDZ domain-containing protein [Pseudomonas sp.]|uniref:PDZ domain-containing protein n=1 Tax=Pseudomonas sp. TaxID=306 RepID=UPI0028AC3107|nr:PDZ domain-containing protein [Pseudomonas sp.]